MIVKKAALVATAALAMAAWTPSVALAEDLGPAVPRAMTLQESEASPRPTLGARETRQEAELDFFDLGAVEAGASLGILAYGSDFESDPQFCGSLSVRAPLPWLSRSVLGFEQDALGFFVQLAISSIDRDFEPDLEHPDSVTFFTTVGLDYAILRDESFVVLAQAGLQIASFGNVTDTDSGAGLLLGLAGGVQIAQGLSITLNPQLSVGSGDVIFFGLVGAQVSF